MEADTGGAASSTKDRHPTIEAPSDAEEDFLRSAKGGLQNRNDISEFSHV